MALKFLSLMAQLLSIALLPNVAVELARAESGKSY